MARTILVVDDNGINRQLLRRILSMDYTVLEAENGQVGFSMLMANYQQISAVLLDIIMPVMDGYEVLARIQKNPALSQIPVIVITGSTDPQTEEKALILGATDFVTKPFDSRAVKQRVQNLIKLRETSAMVNSYRRDQLTGLWNRATFFEKAARAISSHPEGFYVLSSIDIDGFKVINDQYGTEKGDELLKELADRLQHDCNADGSTCGRIAGDEFAILFRSELLIKDPEAEHKHELDITNGLSLPLTISIGRYIVDDKSLSISAMYDRAKIALSTVSGRYDMHIADYDETMLARLTRVQSIISEMNSSLANGQFEPWFQPQYNHTTGALAGAEALARWLHPEHGLISPYEFVPIFERTGFIYELDKFIWEAVCKYLRKWLDQGLTALPVSVNVSRYDLFQADVIQVLTGLRDKYALPNDLLRLEITESAFADMTQVVVDMVKKLIDQGFIVEIDDFGSGYSSLNTLKDVPAQVLKLDMRFIEKSDFSGRGGGILESVVRMTKWLGMSVIAEGVERVEQADFLQSIGCVYMQGFLYARPIPLYEYETLVKAYSNENRISAQTTAIEPDNTTIWDPDSMDALIFNSYVGAACIFEYCGGRVEVLRANEKFAKILGDNITTQQAMNLPWYDALDDEGHADKEKAMSLAIETGGEVSSESVYHNFLGDGRDIYVRSIMRIISSVGDRHLVFCYNENTTEQREASLRLHNVDAQLHAIMNNVSGGVSAMTLINGMPHFLFRSDYYYEMFGYSKEEFDLFPRGLIDIVHPDDQAFALTGANNSEETGDSTPIEFRVIHKAGNIIRVRASGSVCSMSGVDGPVHVVVLYDITKEAEAKEQLEAVIGSIASGITAVIIGENGNVQSMLMADRYYELLGYTREQYKSELKSPFDPISPDDRDWVIAKVQSMNQIGQSESIEFRAICRDGSEIWLRDDISIISLSGIDEPVQLSVFTDITQSRKMSERLKISEAEYRLAVEFSGRLIYHYNHANDCVDLPESVASLFGAPCHLENMPECMIAEGILAEESIPHYREFYNAIKRGDKNGTMTILRKISDGSWRWFSTNFSNVFDDNGNPVSAIMLFHDVTEQREKEKVYKRWQQSINEKPPEDYTLFRWNVNRGEKLDSREGSLLNFFSPEGTSVSQRVANYAKARVHPDDWRSYIEFFNADKLLAAFHKGQRTKTMEFRELQDNSDFRWLRLTAELVEYPDSTDVEAYMIFENIDEAKREELAVRELAERDPLTGVLNRSTFVDKMEQMLRRLPPGAQSALLMLDVDGFKLLNDTFGHATGDQALIDISKSIASVLRHGDLLGRLGGDEFLVCLKDMNGDLNIENKARQITALLRKSFSPSVKVSASIGIAVSPRDGSDFETLYHKADAALYAMKRLGKNGFTIFRPELTTGGFSAKDAAPAKVNALRSDDSTKRRILIVEDNEVNADLLYMMFKDEYLVEKVSDGGSALVCLRHYGTAISVVLLDLMMPGIDGYEILSKMRTSSELQSIPVIVVSGNDDRATALRVIQAGAADFVSKPVDPALIRLRVQSAIAKSDNERLRAQNSVLSVNNSEVQKYRAALDEAGIVVIEYNYLAGTYVYDSSISRYIAGKFDGRRLWHILLSDIVADVSDVKAMQGLVHRLADDRTRFSDSMTVSLKTPRNGKHNFKMSVVKLVNDFQLTEKLLIIFCDLER